MSQMNFLEITHANNGRRIFLVPNLVYAIYYSDADKSTHVVSNSGTFMPAKESVEELKAALSKALGE